MSIPHRCPICEGRGEVGPRLAQTGAELISKKPQRFECHGCARTGIVWDHSFQLNIAPTVTPQPIISKPWISPYQPEITWINNQQNDDGSSVMFVGTNLHPRGEGNTCGCPRYGDEHTDECISRWNPSRPKCESCDGYLIKEPRKGCQRASSHTLPVAR